MKDKLLPLTDINYGGIKLQFLTIKSAKVAKKCFNHYHIAIMNNRERENLDKMEKTTSSSSKRDGTGGSGGGGGGGRGRRLDNKTSGHGDAIRAKMKELSWVDWSETFVALRLGQPTKNLKWLSDMNCHSTRKKFLLPMK